MKKLLLSLMMCMILISCASASFTSLGTFQQDSNVTIRQLCTSCTYNNITSVVYPNGSLAIGEVSMNELGIEYTFGFDKTNPEGTYFVNGFGDLGGTDTVWGYTFEITGTGKPINDNYPFALAAIILITFGISALFMFLTDKMEQPGMKVFFMILGFVFLLAAIGFGMITMQEMNVPENISNGSIMLLFGMGLILFVVMAYILIQIIRNAMEIMKYKSGLKVEMQEYY